MRSIHIGRMVVVAVALLAGPCIVAAYAEPIQVAVITDVADSFAAPSGAHTIVIHDIDDKAYALVASDHHMRIMNITHLADPVPVSSISHGADSAWRGALRDVAAYDISGRTYVLLGSTIDTSIVDITSPDSPIQVSGITHDTHGHAELPGGSGIVIHDISGRTYAVVANDRSVHAVDITHPGDPLHVAVIYVADMGWELVSDIAVHEVAGRTYAVVASWSISGCELPCGDLGYVNIIDITRPAEPFPAATIPHEVHDIGFDWWGGPRTLAVHDISNRTYVVVASDDGIFGYNMIHTLDITQPDNPLLASVITANAGGFANLGEAADIAVHDISNRTYAVIASRVDSSVQIIDITDPDSPAPVTSISDDAGGFTELSGASGIAIHDTSNGTYALVASRVDSGVQIIDITSPAEVSAAHVPAATNVLAATEIAYLHHSGLYGADDVAVHDIANRTYALVVGGSAVRISDVTHPAEPRSVATIRSDGDGFPEWFRPTDITIRDISNRTYAVVASPNDSAVHITDITHPDNPAPVATIRDDAGGFAALDSVTDIVIYDIADRTYALATSWYDSGVQIIDITQPDSPLPVAAITDDASGFSELNWATGIAARDISNRTYALVTSSGDDGVQIIDITQPDSPLPVAAITDDAGGFAELDGARDVAIHDISNGTYAFVASSHDSGVQIIDITQPDSPLPVAAITDDADGFAGLNWAHDITIHDISNGTYAFVASSEDDSVQIIDVTHPDNPLPAGQLVGGRAVTIHDISGRTYVFAVPEYGSVVITDVAGMEPVPPLP